MKRGRKPTPTDQKRARGNPGKRALPANEPKPDLALPLLPDWVTSPLPVEYAALANEVADQAAREVAAARVYTEADAGAFTKLVMARIVERWAWYQLAISAPTGLTVDTGKSVAKHPLVNIVREFVNLDRLLSAEFGLTPSSRAGLKVPEDPPEDPEKQKRQAATHPLRLVPGGKR